MASKARGPLKRQHIARPPRWSCDKQQKQDHNRPYAHIRRLGVCLSAVNRSSRFLIQRVSAQPFTTPNASLGGIRPTWPCGPGVAAEQSSSRNAVCVAWTAAVHLSAANSKSAQNPM